MMNIQRDKLLGGLPVVGHGVVVIFAGFLVHNLMICNIAIFLKWIMILSYVAM